MSNKEQMQELNNKLNQNMMELNSIVNVIAQLPPKQTPETLTITPTKDDQTHRGMYNVVTIIGDEDLKAENIKEGVNIFGVDGTAKTTNAKITSGYYLFANNARIDYINELMKLIENVKSCAYMFYNSSELTSLDLSNLDTSNVTDMSCMFNNCMSLTNLNINTFNTSNVINMYNMFSNCRLLTSLDLKHFDTSKLTSINSMFYYCQELTDLDLSSFDMSKVTNVNSMFYQCNALVNLKFGKNLGKGYTKNSTNYSNYTLAFNSCPKLSHESLMDIINNLYDLTVAYGSSSYKQTLNLGTTNKAKLTADEIAIATNKGWTVT